MTREQAIEIAMEPLLTGGSKLSNYEQYKVLTEYNKDYTAPNEVYLWGAVEKLTCGELVQLIDDMADGLLEAYNKGYKDAMNKYRTDL